MTPYQDPVRVHHRVQSVGDGEDSALRELFPYCLLDNSISPAGDEMSSLQSTELVRAVQCIPMLTPLREVPSSSPDIDISSGFIEY